MDIVSKRGWYFLLSSIIIIPGIISLLIPPAFSPGIDFSSGSAFEVVFEDEINEEEVRSALMIVGHSDARIQKFAPNSVFVRTKELQDGERGSIETELNSAVSKVNSFSKVETVSAEVAGETVRNAIIAVILAAVGILAYITWAFRHIPNSFRYGVSALFALVHDVLIIMGIFSILGKIIDLEVNAMFIVGLLAVVGYSVNDTIVLFDRIRENIARNIDRPLAQSVNIGIMESIGRSLGTSLTTCFAIAALILIGGSTLREFLLVLIIGIAAGTYSSIFIAAQLLVMWERGEVGRFLKLRWLRS
ncbi:protein translocase subunit SecF [SAR202 cluster bacterium AC-409-J13_OGT_754m]|nr:protein translocase subunit SecF [SAR202 cluster bacterium AC-409-J13_OGT_754m]